MKPSDNLHQLIKSLTSNEKRYFKVFSKRHIAGRQSKYEQLFDIYDSLDDDQYDEGVLKQKLKKKGLGKNLADDKKNLQESIMRAMLSFHSGSSVDSQINDLLAEEDFYRQKRLNALRRKTLTKAKELAGKYERLALLYSILVREANMNTEQQQNNLTSVADPIYKEKNELISRLQLMTDLVALHDWLFSLYRINARKNTPSFWEEVEERIAHPSFRTYQVGLGFDTDRVYYSILCIYYVLRQNTAAYNNFVRLQYELYEIHYPHQRDQNRIRYNVSLYNYLYSLQTIRNFDEMKRLLDHASSLEPLNEDEAGESFQNIALYRQLYYMNTFQFAQAVGMTNEIEEGISKYDKKINTSSKLTFYSNIAIAYMMTEDWDKVLDYTEKIISEKIEVRIDVKHEAMLHQLIARYELKQYDLLSYQSRNVQRMLSSSGQLSDGHSYIIRLINRLNKDGKDHFKSLRTSADTAVRHCAEHSGIEIWLHARIHAIPMADSARAIEAIKAGHASG